MKFRHLGIAALASLLATGAYAQDCAFETEMTVKMVGSDIKAWKSVAKAMAECAKVEADLDEGFRLKMAPALAANPALYHIAGVSNSTIPALLNDGTIRPLDDLVAKYGQNLKPNQLVEIDGKVMAIAALMNTQHLMYRKDILDDLGIAVPATWDEVLAAAEKIEAADVVDYPLGATMKTGWNLAQEFNNMFLGYGGTFVNPDNTPAVNSEAGLNALATMKRITAYLDPEYLNSGDTVVQQQFQQGKIAMSNLWATRAGPVNDPAESQVTGKVFTAAAPRAVPGGPPAATLWWVGIVLAKNISQADAETAFRVAMEGMDTETVTANNDDAIWLIEGYQPDYLAEGAIANATADPAPIFYPSTAWMGLMHTALGNNLAGFFTGERSAADTLAAVEAEYTTAARESGLIQ